MGDKKYLIVKGVCGLGNRIENALTCILYAKLSQRVLYIDWSDPILSADGTNVFNQLFTLIDVEHVRELPQDILKASKKIEARKTCNTFHRIDYPDPILKVVSALATVGILRKHLTGSFSHYAPMTVSQIFGELLSKHFILDQNIRNQVEDFKSKHFKGKMIGIHARYTDSKRPRDFFDQATREMLSKFPDANILLCTDNEKLQHEFKEEHKKVVFREKWFPSKEGVTLYANKECPDRLQSAIDALIDMWLLAECDALIYSKSSTFTTVPLAISQALEQDRYDIDQMPLFVSVVICLDKEADMNLLRECLLALHQQTYPKDLYEVRIVHNGISLETIKWINLLKSTSITYENTPSPYGLRNRGIMESKGEVVGVLSADCIPNKNWIENGVKGLKSKNRSAAFIFGAIKGTQSNKKHRTVVELYQDLYMNEWAQGLLFRSRNHRNFMERSWVDCQSNMFFHKHMFDHAGLFNSNVQYVGDVLWWEDLKNPLSYYFSPNTSVEVRSPNKIRTIRQLFGVIIKFTDEYYKYKNKKKEFKKDFEKDGRFISKVINELLRKRTELDLAVRIKIAGVALFISFVRAIRRLWLKAW